MLISTLPALELQIKKAEGILDRDYLSVFTQLLQTCYYLQSLLSFKIGDRVRLAETPVINSHTSWGWMGYRDILVLNAPGTVLDISIYANEERYQISFDAKPSDIFTISAKYLAKI